MATSSNSVGPQLSDKIIKQYKKEKNSTIQVDPDARKCLRQLATQFLQDVQVDATQRMTSENRKTILLRDVVNGTARIVSMQHPTLSVPVLLAKIFKVPTFPNIAIYRDADFPFQDNLYITTNAVERVDSSNSLQLKEIREALKKDRKAARHANAFMARAVDFFILFLLDEAEKRTILDRKKRIMPHHVAPHLAVNASGTVSAANTKPKKSRVAITPTVIDPLVDDGAGAGGAGADEDDDNGVDDGADDGVDDDNGVDDGADEDGVDEDDSADEMDEPVPEPEPIPVAKPKQKPPRKKAAAPVVPPVVVSTPVLAPALVAAPIRVAVLNAASAAPKKKRKQPLEIDPAYVTAVQQATPKKQEVASVASVASAAFGSVAPAAIVASAAATGPAAKKSKKK